MPGWDFVLVQDDVNLHIPHMLEGPFSLDMSYFCVKQFVKLGLITC